MKIGIGMCLLAAAVLFFFTTESADAAMYVDSEERRATLFGTFVIFSGLVGALCVLFMAVTRNSTASEEPQLSSVVVPPIKQESNIVRHLVTA